MQLPTLEKDYWHLLSGEEAHRAHPQTFSIPSVAERKDLTVGNAAKLMFEIESVDQDGKLILHTERMWVIVSRKVEDTYIGILDSKPASFEPEDKVYLCFGAEIPFKPEHVIDIAQPPEEYVEWQLSQEPEKRWYR